MSGFAEYESYDALGLAELVRKAEVSPEELLEEAISRTEARNPSLRAVVVKMYEEARGVLARGLPEGPLRGVPFLLKDLYPYYGGGRITYGSRLFRDFVADHDAELVTRYKRAGLVIFGRTASPEFGLTSTTESVLHGPTVNPWNHAHTAGGSSGGAAVAVAVRIVPAAHASDGGGSIRIPASCCGLFGLKPTRARLPLGPDVGEGWSGMSVMHVVTRSVRDSAALLDVVAGPDVGAPYWAPPPSRPFLEEMDTEPQPLRVALVTRAFNGVETHPDCVAAVQDAALLCAELGHRVEETTLTVDAQALGKATRVIVSANLRASIDERLQTLGRELGPEDLEPITHAMALHAQSMSAAQYAAAVGTVHAAGRQVGRFFERFDVLLTPTMATPPLKLGQLALTHPEPSVFAGNLARTIGYTQLMNAAGNPAMSVPLFWNSEGLPVGVQFAGRFGKEETLFRLAAQLEKARPWAHKHPV